MTIVTGWTGLGYQELGEQFIRTFDEFWPNDIHVIAIVNVPAFFHGRYLDRLTTKDAYDCDGLLDFLKRHEGNALYRGKAPHRNWTPNEKRNGYSFRFDAVKFAPQLFFPEHAAKELPDGDILTWFDADVLTHSKVPVGFIESLIGDSDLVYLGRPPRHSEIGFWAVRLNDSTRKFLTSLADMYRSDHIFLLSEWHSAFVFDYVRLRYEMGGMVAKNLTPQGHSHVWHQSPLCNYTSHLKGKLKWIKRDI